MALSLKIKLAVTLKIMDRMFDPSPARPTFPIANPQHEVEEVADEVEDVHQQHDARSYYEPSPRVFHSQTHSVDVLEKVSKETIILVFAAFFIGLLLGKSLTPVILKH
jgi:hypothetical protein